MYLPHNDTFVLQVFNRTIIEYLLNVMVEWFGGWRLVIVGAKVGFFIGRIIIGIVASNWSVLILMLTILLTGAIMIRPLIARFSNINGSPD